MRIVNLTPHPIVVRTANNEITLPPSGEVARVTAVAVPLAEVDGIPVVKTDYGPVTGLPEPRPGTLYLVSSLVAQAAARQGRTDVVAPDTGPQSAIRGPDGQIVAVRRLQAF